MNSTIAHVSDVIYQSWYPDDMTKFDVFEVTSIHNIKSVYDEIDDRRTLNIALFASQDTIKTMLDEVRGWRSRGWIHGTFDYIMRDSLRS